MTLSKVKITLVRVPIVPEHQTTALRLTVKDLTLVLPVATIIVNAFYVSEIDS